MVNNNTESKLIKLKNKKQRNFAVFFQQGSGLCLTVQNGLANKKEFVNKANTTTSCIKGTKKFVLEKETVEENLTMFKTGWLSQVLNSLFFVQAPLLYLTLTNCFFILSLKPALFTGVSFWRLGSLKPLSISLSSSYQCDIPCYFSGMDSF